MTKRRIAVIGAGMASPPHAQSLLDLADRVEVAGVFSRERDKLDRFAARFAFPVTDALEPLFADRSIEAVLVLTPPATHLEVVERAAAAGKHVLLEKPVEVTAERASRLVEAAERAGITLGLVLQSRFKPNSLKLEALLRAGALGEVAAASASIRWWRPQSYYDEPGRGTKARDGGGVLLTQAIHALDLFQSLAGPIVEVTGFAATSALHRMETEDLVCAGVRFANGALGTIDATTASYPGFPERLELVGTRATAVLHGNGGLELYWQDGRRERFEGETQFGGGADPMAFAHDHHRAVLADFLDALDAKRPPTVSGREALKVHRLIDALLRSSEARRPIAIEH
jgi:UDP-N-acetyl-2-amino-2-deoxyglucuronate dehydrogenase